MESQDRSCLVFFELWAAPGLTKARWPGSWSPNCALGSRPLQMLLKDSSGPGPVDAVDLLAVSLWCWTAVLSRWRAGRARASLGHGHSQMSCPAVCRPPRSPGKPSGRTAPNCLTIAYVKTDTGKRGAIRGTDPGSSEAGGGQEPLVHLHWAIPVMGISVKSSFHAHV